jgi:hypothetical protein
MLASNYSARPPRVQNLISGPVTVPPGKIYQVRFSVDTAPARVVGQFRAVGGTGNDTEAVVADEDSFENWSNGHPSKVLYSSGRVTVGTVDAWIRKPGTYYVAFSNRSSVLSSKQVDANIDLIHQ